MPYMGKAKEIATLVGLKQRAYGDSFGRSEEILAVLYPNGVGEANYKDLLTIVRIIDKLFRICNDKHAFGESPWQDIAGYALLALVADEEEGENGLVCQCEHGSLCKHYDAVQPGPNGPCATCLCGSNFQHESS